MSLTDSPAEPHDHSLCIEDALEQARLICEQRKVRLTAIREQVLGLIWQSHKPIGAYDLLEQLAKTHHAAKPPTIYRALEFLQDNGLIHKIESQNAFLGCAHVGGHHHGQFLICTACGTAQEIDEKVVSSALENASQAQGFKIQSFVIEIKGLCTTCQDL
ncbi:MAG: transcriptional repressor [Parvibaculaceae bacterium]|nr:transcriptional repressor [Parvibaculaceae bacterium]